MVGVAILHVVVGFGPGVVGVWLGGSELGCVWMGDGGSGLCG